MASRREERKEQTARLETVCAELASDLGVEPPVCRVTGSRRVAAGVWLNRYRGRGLMFVGRGAMERLDPMALRWLVAHELGHVADREGRRRLRVGKQLCLLIGVLIFCLPFAPGALFLMAALMVANGVIACDIRRRLEEVADATAHRCCATDPDAGRRALRAARESCGVRYEPLYRLVEKMSGYPPLEQRMDPARA